MKVGRKDTRTEAELAKKPIGLQVVWLVIAIIGALVIGSSHLLLRNRAVAQSRWAWWREFHERMRRYPTSQEVEDWTSEQTRPTGL